MANITYRLLPVKLREDEIFAAGDHLAQETSSLDKIETEKAEAAKQFSDAIKATRTNMARLATMIETGEETRSVPCEVVMHSPVKGMKAIVRADTGETVDDMPMTEKDKEEFQSSLQVPMFPLDSATRELRGMVERGELEITAGKVG